MKKICICLVAGFCLGKRVSAQDFHWGVQGGLNLSGGIAKETGVIIKGRPAAGYALGVLGDMALANPKWSVRAGLTFQHEASVADIFDDQTHIRVNYFNLPIDLVWHPGFAEKRWVFGAGAWFAYGLSGKYRQDGDTYSIRFGSSEANDAHRLDLGLNLLAGYTLNEKMMLQARFDYGLKDVSAQPDFVTIYTRSFGVNFVYWMPKSIGMPKKK
jgi:hypothetical protein